MFSDAVDLRWFVSRYSRSFGITLLVRLAVTAILLGLASVFLLLPAENVKRVRLLHLADTHAQLDTHWEYLPEDPSQLHKMGGFARIRTALDEKRGTAPGAVFTVDGGDTVSGIGDRCVDPGRSRCCAL